MYILLAVIVFSSTGYTQNAQTVYNSTFVHREFISQEKCKEAGEKIKELMTVMKTYHSMNYACVSR